MARSKDLGLAPRCSDFSSHSSLKKADLSGLRIVHSNILERFCFFLKLFELAFSHAFCIFTISVLKICYFLLPGLSKWRLVGDHELVNTYILSCGPASGQIEKQKAFHCP